MKLAFSYIKQHLKLLRNGQTKRNNMKLVLLLYVSLLSMENLFGNCKDSIDLDIVKYFGNHEKHLVQNQDFVKDKKLKWRTFDIEIISDEKIELVDSNYSSPFSVIQYKMKVFINDSQYLLLTHFLSLDTFNADEVLRFIKKETTMKMLYFFDKNYYYFNIYNQILDKFGESGFDYSFQYRIRKSSLNKEEG